MKYYIVWFNDDYEQAEASAELVQDITLPWLPGQNAQDALAKYLVSKGHPANAIRNIQPVGRFMHDINNVEIGPSRCYNLFIGFFAHCEPLNEHPTFDAAMQDIAYLMRHVGSDIRPIDQLCSDCFSDADVYWLYHRYQRLITDWQSDKGLTLNDLGYCVEDVLNDDNSDIRREVVIRWATAVVEHQCFNHGNL